MHPVKKIALFVIAVLASKSIGQDAFVPLKGYLNLNSGEVEIESAGGVKRKIVRQSESQNQDPIVLEPGDLVRTDAQTHCSISFPPYGGAQLEVNTAAKLPAATPPVASSLELLSGKLFLDVSQMNLAPSKRQFRLKTPSMILAVKGTRFFAESRDEAGTVGVHSGEVEVFRSLGGRSISLREGEAISAVKGKFTPPRPLSAAERSMRDRYAPFAVRYELAERQKRSFRKEAPRMEVTDGDEIDGSRSLMVQMEEKDARFRLNLATLKSSPDYAYFKIRAKNVGFLAIAGWFKTVRDGKIGIARSYRLIEMKHDSTQWMDCLLPMQTDPNFGGTPIEEGQLIFIMVSEPGGSWFELSPVFAGHKEK